MCIYRKSIVKGILSTQSCYPWRNRPKFFSVEIRRSCANYKLKDFKVFCGLLPNTAHSKYPILLTVGATVFLRQPASGLTLSDVLVVNMNALSFSAADNVCFKTVDRRCICSKSYKSFQMCFWVALALSPQGPSVSTFI